MIVSGRPNETANFDSPTEQMFNGVAADESRPSSNKCDTNLLHLLLHMTVSLTLRTYKSIFKKVLTSKKGKFLCSLTLPIKNGVPIGSFRQVQKLYAC